MVYFTEVEGDIHHIPKVKLLNGQKQKGVLKSTNDSMVYYFKLSSEIKEDIEVRLDSENGHFKLYLGDDFVPDLTNFTYSGDDRSPIIFNQSDNLIAGQEVDIHTYYLRIVP